MVEVRWSWTTSHGSLLGELPVPRKNGAKECETVKEKPTDTDNYDEGVHN